MFNLSKIKHPNKYIGRIRLTASDDNLALTLLYDSQHHSTSRIQGLVRLITPIILRKLYILNILHSHPSQYVRTSLLIFWLVLMTVLLLGRYSKVYIAFYAFPEFFQKMCYCFTLQYWSSIYFRFPWGSPFSAWLFQKSFSE